MILLLGAQCLVDSLGVVLDSLLLVAAGFVCTAYRCTIHLRDTSNLVLKEAVGKHHGAALSRSFAYSAIT